MKPEEAFHAFSPAHLVVIFLTIAVPLGLAAVVRASGSRWLERIVAMSLAACLTMNYLGAAIFLWHHHHLYWAEMLPFQLCDWAMFVIIVALSQRAPQLVRNRLFLGHRWNIAGDYYSEFAVRISRFPFLQLLHRPFRNCLGRDFSHGDARLPTAHLLDCTDVRVVGTLFCRHLVRRFCDWCELRILAAQTGNVFALELPFRLAASLSSPDAWARSALFQRALCSIRRC